jgi:hypothetical protein
MAVILDSVQRDAIRKFVLSDIVEAGMLAVALEEGEDTLQRLRSLLDQSMRFLGQIGWEKDGTKERYEVVLSEADQLAIFGRFHERATNLINDAMGAFADDFLKETFAVAKVAGDALSELADGTAPPSNTTDIASRRGVVDQ